MPPEPTTANGNEGNRGGGGGGGAAADEEKEPLKVRIKNGLINFFHSFRLFIYNKERQTVFGKTPADWIKLATYYSLFYVCLGLFYSGMVAVFAAIVARESPTYTYTSNEMKEEGTLYTGLSFRPMQNYDLSLTVYNDTESQNKTVSSLNSYRIVFLSQDDNTFVSDCSPTEPASKLQSGRSCRFRWSDIVPDEKHPCSQTKLYGWATGKPCVLVKLNQIYGWVPNSGSVLDQVKNETGQEVLKVDQHTDNIYITCNGRDVADKDAIGNRTYYSLLHPEGHSAYGGIPYYFFPYKNAKDQVQPFVLVQFEALPLNQLVTVLCRAWAPGIPYTYEGTATGGTTTFNLFKSNKNSPKKN